MTRAILKMPSVSRDVSLATNEALKSNMAMRLGAVVYDRQSGRRFFGHNANYTSSISIHAEMDALQKVLKRHKLMRAVRVVARSPRAARRFWRNFDIDLTVVRIGSGGHLRSSKPCVECARVLQACRLIGITFRITYIDDCGKPATYKWDSDHKCKSHTF